MAISLEINGQTYLYPEVGDVAWGPDATDWAVAVNGGMLQKAGGLFQLLAEADFGSAYGLKSLYYKTRTTNPADAGQFRLARADVVSWRNQANDGNLDLSVNSSNALLFNGVALGNFVSVLDTATIDLTLAAGVLSADIKSDCITNSMINSAAAIAFSKLAALTSGNILVGNVSNVATSVAMSGDVVIDNAGVTAISAGAIVNADVNASAAIAYSKLAALTASRVLVSDGSGFVSASSVTSTTLGYLDATSSIQTQLDAKAPKASPTFSGTVLLQNAAGAQPELHFSEDPDNGTNVVKLKAPAALSGDVTLTLPDNDGDSGQALITDGAGGLSWASLQTLSNYLWVAKSADYTILDNDNYRYIDFTNAGTNYTVTLPSAANNTNRIITIYKVDGLDSDGTGKLIISGASTELYTAGDNITVVSTGSIWRVEKLLQRECVYNTSSNTTTSDTTSFAYGTGGALIRDITLGLARRVRFLSSITTLAKIELQVSKDQVRWGIPGAVSGIGIENSLRFDGTNTFGACWDASDNATNATDIDSQFGTLRTGSRAWSNGSVGTTVYWRIVKTVTI